LYDYFCCIPNVSEFIVIWLTRSGPFYWNKVWMGTSAAVTAIK